MVVHVEEGEDAEADEDFGDRLISPAFVNPHTHLAMCFARGLKVPEAASGNRVENFFFTLESRLSAAQVQAFTRMGAYDSLLAGVGLVWEHYYFPAALVAGLRDTGLCGVVAPTLQDVSGPGADRWEASLEATLVLDDDLGAQAAGIFAALGPHATDTVSAQLWERIKALATTRELPLHYHLSQSLEEYERAHERHACTPIEWLRRNGVLELEVQQLLVHAIFSGRDDLQSLDASRHCLVWCPRSAAFFAFPARTDLWQSVGANWVVGSDAAASNDAMDPRAELFEIQRARTGGVSGGADYGAFLAKPAVQGARDLWAARAKHWEASEAWTTPEALLSRVWSRPGKLHPRVKAGVLESGALANLIVWELEHPATWPAPDPLHALCYSTPSGGAAIHNLMTMGQWRGESGRYVQSVVGSGEYKAAKTEADARLAELLGTF